MANASALTTDCFQLFIVSDASVSSSEMDDILVTIWSDGVRRGSPHRGITYRIATEYQQLSLHRRRSVTLGIHIQHEGFRAHRHTDEEGIDEATFKGGDFNISGFNDDPDEVLANFSAGTHVY